MDEFARDAARLQWNTTACGETEGEKTSIEYFNAVEVERYQQQPWMHTYFRFEDFKNKKVLEIGVGQGTDLMQFARAGADCHGVDITDNHLELTALNAELRGVSIELYKSDATKLPFKDNSIDCVYSFGVLHHIPEATAVINEIFRVLSPGGTVMIALYNKWSAFHLIKVFLVNGVIRGWLFTKGYRGLLSTIEFGADGVKIKPYVKLYTEKSAKSLLKKFDIIDVSTRQIFLNHILPDRLSHKLQIFSKVLCGKAMESRFGWYVAAVAKKPKIEG